MHMDYQEIKVESSLRGCLNLVLKEILECYKPVDELSYWKAFKDSDNVWRKKKVELSDEELSSIIEDRRKFLNENPLIDICNGEVFFNVKFSREKLIELFDQFLLNGCDNTLYCQIISALKDNPLVDD